MVSAKKKHCHLCGKQTNALRNGYCVDCDNASVEEIVKKSAPIEAQKKREEREAKRRESFAKMKDLYLRFDIRVLKDSELGKALIARMEKTGEKPSEICNKGLARLLAKPSAYVAPGRPAAEQVEWS